MTKKPFMLHITKTGGTAIKWLEHQKIPLPFEMARYHYFNLDTMRQQGRRVMFVLRHPLERFCSGFWEAITQPERQKIAYQRKPESRGFWLGYGEWTPHEAAILEQCRTPDELLTYWRTNGELPGIAKQTLFLTTAGLSWWLGDLAQYQRNEDAVAMVIEMGDLSEFIRQTTGAEMPSDPFYRRDRGLFGIERDDTISADNVSWFQDHLRSEDYRLIQHIRASGRVWTPERDPQQWLDPDFR